MCVEEHALFLERFYPGDKRQSGHKFLYGLLLRLRGAVLADHFGTQGTKGGDAAFDARNPDYKRKYYQEVLRQDPGAMARDRNSARDWTNNTLKGANYLINRVKDVEEAMEMDADEARKTKTTNHISYCTSLGTAELKRRFDVAFDHPEGLTQADLR
jgi:hypothetical protein